MQVILVELSFFMYQLTIMMYEWSKQKTSCKNDRMNGLTKPIKKTNFLIKETNMKQLLTAFLFFFYMTASAQKVVDVTKNDYVGATNFYSVAGEPFVNSKFVRLKAGSPYFVDDWMKGKGLAESGQTYAGGTVKLNLL